MIVGGGNVRLYPPTSTARVEFGVKTVWAAVERWMVIKSKISLQDDFPFSREFSHLLNPLLNGFLSQPFFVSFSPQHAFGVIF